MFWFRIWSFISVMRKGGVESRGRKGIVFSIVGIVMAEASTSAALGRRSLSALPHSLMRKSLVFVLGKGFVQEGYCYKKVFHYRKS
jgi:hypothetical protein